ncbi:unnamed protein product [Ectocarpus sp. 12 AP-2014]
MGKPFCCANTPWQQCLERLCHAEPWVCRKSKGAKPSAASAEGRYTPGHITYRIILFYGKIKSVLKYLKTTQGQRLERGDYPTCRARQLPSAKRPTGKRGVPAEPWAGTAPNAGAAGSTTEGQAGNRQQCSAVSRNVSLSFLHQTLRIASPHTHRDLPTRAASLAAVQ